MSDEIDESGDPNDFYLKTAQMWMQRAQYAKRRFCEEFGKSAELLRRVRQLEDECAKARVERDDLHRRLDEVVRISDRLDETHDIDFKRVEAQRDALVIACRDLLDQWVAGVGLKTETLDRLRGVVAKLTAELAAETEEQA